MPVTIDEVTAELEPDRRTPAAPRPTESTPPPCPACERRKADDLNTLLAERAARVRAD